MVRRFFGPFASEVLVEPVVALSEGLTGAQIRQIAEECIREAVLEDRETVPFTEAVAAVLSTGRGGAKSANSRDEMIRSLRKKSPKTFTQTRLAELFGISQSQVSKLLKEA